MIPAPRRTIGALLLALVFALLPHGAKPAAAVTGGPTAPAIFYTDLTSGPSAGGENGNGTILTLYGKRFGSAQGSATVSIGSGAAAGYKLWSDTKIAVAVGSAATTGNVVVHAPAGDSNRVPFTVRPGNIYCVSTTGSDSNPGLFPAQCWRTLPFAKTKLAAGDIAYIEDGVHQTTVDNYTAALSLQSAGAPGRPIALVAYPGATVTVGTDTMNIAIRTPAISGGPFSHWVLAGLTLRGWSGLELWGVDDFRVVGNDLACINGTAPPVYACVETVTTTNSALLGNTVHDTGINCGSGCKLYHGVYIGTDSNHIEVGWNTIVPRGGCRALQFHSTGGADQFDLHVHDNLIHDAVCDGVNFATVNAANGPVEAFNNVIYHVGTGPAPSGIEANYACFNVMSAGSTGTVHLFNNTLYDCGPRQNSDSGAFSIYTPTRLDNNLVQQLSGESYFTPSDGNCALISGNNNLWFGFGAPPACPSLVGNVAADPRMVSVLGADFHLQSGSPAIDAGTSIPNLLSDFDGVPRPQGPAYDIGAYEFVSALVPPPAGPGTYHPLPPARSLDTRDGMGGVPISPLGTGGLLDVQITGRGGVPATGVAAVVVNVTVTNTSLPGYLTVYPAGVARPTASNLNWVAGQTVANLVEVALGGAGTVRVFNLQGTADVVFDVAGYVSTPNGPAGPDGLFNPVVPARLLDTRDGTGTAGPAPVGPGGILKLQVTSRGGLPTSGISAVVLNVTATNPTAGSYVTVYPDGAARPLASNLNLLARATVPNRVIVKVGTGGFVDFFNFSGTVDLVADVGGWFTDSTSSAGGTRFTGLTPTRILDTRVGGSPIAANAFIGLQVAGAGGVPTTATAVVANVTVTNPTLPSYLTVFPSTATRPLASDLNYVAGQTVPNLVVVKLGPDGKVDLYNFAGTTDAIVDVVGYYN